MAMQVVKYEWANSHGVTFTDWTLALAEYDESQIRCPGGHGVVTSFRVLDRCPVPEDLRRDGYISIRKARVSLAMHSYTDRDISATEFVERMKVAEV